MYWVRRLLAPQNCRLVVYALVLAALSIAGLFYRGVIQRQDLARVTSSVRRAFVDKAEIPKIKLERATLEFQLPNLPSHFPLLTNAALAHDWSAAAIFGQLDPDVRGARNTYLNRVASLVLQTDPSLESYLALQRAYELDVDKLILHGSVPDKSAALLSLRTNKFGSLFSNPVYVRDGAKFDKASEQLGDAQTAALRRDYWAALVSAVTNLNPALAPYGSARLTLEAQSTRIRTRLGELNRELREVGELPEPASRPAWSRIVARTRGQSTSGGFFNTYAPQEKDFVTIELATLALGFLLTLPCELRHRRWLKIGASMVLVYAGLLLMRVPMSAVLGDRHENGFAFLGYLVPAVLLAAIWTPSLTHMLSRVFMHLIDSPDSGPTEVPSLRTAYQEARQGNLHAALRLAKEKPSHDPGHYESLLLKAKIHRRLNHKWRTKWLLKKILRTPHLTEGQRRHISSMAGCLKDKTHECWK